MSTNTMNINSIDPWNIINNYNYDKTDILIPLITIPSVDLLLCLIFTQKARWFQLHSVINGIIVYIIQDDVINLYKNPITYSKILDTKIEFYFITFLHIYHLIISSNLTMMDYFHHILFIGFGCVPAYLLYDNNLIRLGTFASCGITGCIEYFSLALVKHQKLHPITQKKYNSYLYNYVRYPLTVYCNVSIYISYRLNYLIGNPYFLIYINLIIFYNGAFYNKLTLENYMGHKVIQHYIKSTV